MSFGRERRSKPARQPASRRAKKKILIVCEGKNTEPQYFRQFAAHHREAIVDVDVAPQQGVPLSVVQEAKRLKKAAADASKLENDPYLKYDSVWCVFDRDEHPNVAAAVIMAKKNHLKIALSNPCFELWLVLHLRTPPGMIDRHKMQKLLKTFIANYDKKVDYLQYKDGYEMARERARKLDELAESAGAPGGNPTTGVYKLTETIVPIPNLSPRSGKQTKRHGR